MSDLSHGKFRNLIKEHIVLLNNSSKKLQEELQNHQNISEETLGEINVVIGQSELLIKEKFSQFATLIEDSESKKGEKEITLQDLQGFWDIIYLQVESILKKIENLNKLKESNWELTLSDVLIKPKFSPKKAKIGTKPKRIGGTTTKSNVRGHILALRKKMKEQQEKKQKCDEAAVEDKENIDEHSRNLLVAANDKEEVKNFDAGFFKVATPVKTPKILFDKPKDTPVRVQSSPMILASNGLREKFINTPVIHKDYSPFMRVTRSMKKRLMESQPFNLSP